MTKLFSLFILLSFVLPVSGQKKLDWEETVLQLLAQKKTASDIATELFISIPTVKTHTQSIYRKFDIHSRAELLALLDAEMPVSEEAD